MKYPFSFFLLLIAFISAPYCGLACDNHLYKAKMCTWHTKALKPLLPNLAGGSLNPDTAFDYFTQSMRRSGAHLDEIYPILGLNEIKHYDVLQLYKDRTGRVFKQDPVILSYINELNAIRSKHQYMAYCINDLQNLRIDMSGTVKDTLLSDAVGAAIDLFEEDGSFWDQALSVYALDPKSKDAVRRDSWDLANFCNYYMALRQLGLTHDFAHAIASLETAYAAVQCKNCGAW